MGDHSSRHNRKTVVVDQTMLKAPTITVQLQSKSQSRDSSLSMDPSFQDSVAIPSKVSPLVSHLSEQNIADQPNAISLPGSVQSSCSSLADTTTNTSSAATTLTESTIIEYLTCQVSQSAMKIYQLEKEVQRMPQLQLEIDKLEKERTKLANSMLDSQELVETMKQRISVLHEQNEQLAQLTSSAKSESSEVIRIRNTLVASLAQLKQLQKQVDTIPALKVQLRLLADENSQLKEVKTKREKVEYCHKFEPADNQVLLKENEKLKHLRLECVQSLNGLKEQVCAIDRRYDEVKQQIETGSSSASVVQVLQDQIKRLESERDSLHHEVVEMKLHGSRCVNLDMAYLINEVSSLKTENSHLKIQLQDQSITFKLQKDQLILKLLELEKVKAKSQRYLVEEQILKISTDDKLDSSESMSGSQQELCDGSTLPNVQQQLLKLHQLKLYCEQSHHLVQSMIAERKELENSVDDLTTKLKELQITEIQSQLSEKETKLTIACKRIDHLEQRLNHSACTDSDLASLLTENERLTQKVDDLQFVYQQSLDVIRDLKTIEEQHKFYESQQLTLRKAKDDKRKAEKRYKHVNDKLQSVAKELSSSTELLKDYQSQCAKLQKDLESTLAENSSIRSEAAVLKADLEVARMEINATVYRSTLESNKIHELQQLCDELSDENKKLRNDLEKSVVEFQEKITVIKNENIKLSDEAVKCTSLIEAGMNEIKEKAIECEALQAKLTEMKLSLDSAVESKSRLKKSLETLQSEYDQSSGEVAKLNTQLQKVVQQCDVLTNRISMSEEDREQDKLLHVTTKQMLKKSEELTHDLQLTNGNLQTEIQYLKIQQEELNQKLMRKDQELESLYCVKSEAASLVASTEKKIPSNVLTQSETYTEARIASLSQEKAELLSKLQNIEDVSQATQIESKLQDVNHELALLYETHKAEKNELDQLKKQCSKLTSEVEGYKAMVDSLHKRLEEAETREIEHEQLRSKIKNLERLLGDSSHDNKTLVKLLHETVSELPTYSTEATRSLQDENLKLEEQVSVLSQWNDKQRLQIEDLERHNCRLEKEKHQLLLDFTTKEGQAQENLQLKRELKEIEREINMLRRQVRADVDEELQIKIETQTKLLSVLSQHNDTLRLQVEQLQKKVLSLGGELDKQTPASPPPMPDVSNFVTSNDEEVRQRTWSNLERENLILKQRIRTMESEVQKLHSMSSSVRRRSSTLHALSSVPLGSIHKELQIK